MSLRLSLILVLWLVTAGAGLGALAWTTAEAYRAAALDTRTTLARAGEVLERNYRWTPAPLGLRTRRGPRSRSCR